MKNMRREYFNVLLSASKVSRALDELNSVLSSDSISKKLEKGLQRAELFVLQASNTEEPLSLEFIRYISTLLFKDLYAWAGKFRKKTFTTKAVKSVSPRAIEPALNKLIKELSDTWDQALQDEEYRYWVLAYVYYEILRIKPFYDGNEKLARLLMNYIAVKFNLPAVELAPPKDTPEYQSYLLDLKIADDFDELEPLVFRIKKAFRNFNIEEHFVSVNLPALVLEADMEEDVFYD